MDDMPAAREVTGIFAIAMAALQRSRTLDFLA